MFGWLGGLSWRERTALNATFGAWTADGFSVQLFAFVLPGLLSAWHVTTSAAGFLATMTLLASAFGGWIAGAFADRFGRVRVLQVVVAWFALFTFLSGFTQDFQQLFICRVLQGFGAGAEWAVGTVLMGEVIRDTHRGRAVGLVQAGWPLGWGIAAVLYMVLTALLPESLAWRVLFWSGLGPALLVLWMRRNLDEPDYLGAEEPSGFTQIAAMFRSAHWPTTWRVSLMLVGAQGSSYALLTFLPIYLRTERHLTAVGTAGYLLALIAGSFLGIFTGGYLADRIGRKATFMVSLIGSAMLTVVAMLFPFTNQIMMPVGFLLGFISMMMFAPMGPLMTELFPAAVRAVAQGFCYNFGRAVGAIFPALVGMLAGLLGLGWAIAIFAGCGFALMMVGLSLLPETRGRTLESLEAVIPAEAASPAQDQPR